MKNLILFLTMFLLSASVFAQPNPKNIPPHSRPKTVVEPSPETTYPPVDATVAPCQMTVADGPTINGVKLGLTPDELGKTFKIKITPTEPAHNCQPFSLPWRYRYQSARNTNGY